MPYRIYGTRRNGKRMETGGVYTPPRRNGKCWIDDGDARVVECSPRCFENVCFEAYWESGNKHVYNIYTYVVARTFFPCIPAACMQWLFN